MALALGGGDLGTPEVGLHQWKLYNFASFCCLIGSGKEESVYFHKVLFSCRKKNIDTVVA